MRRNVCALYAVSIYASHEWKCWATEDNVFIWQKNNEGKWAEKSRSLITSVG